MLRSNDVSNDAKWNRHATVTDVTQKAHGCRYTQSNPRILENAGTGWSSFVQRRKSLFTGRKDVGGLMHRAGQQQNFKIRFKQILQISVSYITYLHPNYIVCCTTNRRLELLRQQSCLTYIKCTRL